MQIICIPKIRNIILVLKFICRTHIMWSHLIKIDILWGDPKSTITHDVIICTFFIFIRIDYFFFKISQEQISNIALEVVLGLKVLF